jgi:hypothetical protein
LFAQVSWTTVGSDTEVTASGRILLAGFDGTLKQGDFYVV